MPPHPDRLPENFQPLHLTLRSTSVSPTGPKIEDHPSRGHVRPRTGDFDDLLIEACGREVEQGIHPLLGEVASLWIETRAEVSRCFGEEASQWVDRHLHGWHDLRASDRRLVHFLIKSLARKSARDSGGRDV